jgi:starch synthase
MISRPELIQVLSHATVFVTPSVYEPLGIVNLEAMACETAVVATRTGGIPEVVEDGVTGLLVPIEPRGDGTGGQDPAHSRPVAERIETVLADPVLAERFGRAGRERVVDHFAWDTIAERVVEVYRGVLA